MDAQDENFLLMAIEQAKESCKQGGFPAGAIIVKDGKIIGRGISIGTRLCDPTSHGEMAAIRNACHGIQSADLSGASIRLDAAVPDVFWRGALGRG